MIVYVLSLVCVSLASHVHNASSYFGANRQLQLESLLSHPMTLTVYPGDKKRHEYVLSVQSLKPNEITESRTILLDR